MLRSQKILIAAVLLLIAALLHFSLCDWVLNDSQRPVGARPHILLVGVEFRGSMGDRVTGIVADTYSGFTVSFLLGVITPLALVSFDAWFVLGWRRSSRIARGMCAHCGYDLRGSAGASGAGPAKCPECGLQAAEGTKHAA